MDPYSPLSRLRPGMLLIVRGILVLALLAGLEGRAWMTMFIAGLSLALTFLPALLRHWHVIDLPLAFEITGALFILASLFLGELHGWYTRFWWWDLFLHGTSAIVIGIIGYLFLSALLQATRARASPVLVATFTFSFALAIGTLWEVVEYLIDLSLGTSMQKSGLTDTMTDLLIDAFGALLAGVAAAIHVRDRQEGWLERLWRAFHTRNRWLFRPEPPARLTPRDAAERSRDDVRR